MIALKTLQATNAELGELIVEGSGYCLWVTWPGEVNAVLEQTLGDYGGIKVRTESNQALWFFFTVDAFLAAAKLEVWAKFNQLAVGIQIFEAHLRCGSEFRYELQAHPDIWEQRIEIPTKFEVFILGNIMPSDKSLSGLSLKPAKANPGFADGDWYQQQVDTRLPYKSTLGWYAVLKPVGSPIDKVFQVGWRDFYGKIEDVLQRNKLRFTIHDNYLMIPLESLRQLKQWCRDYLGMVLRQKNNEDDGKYWPCVLGIADKKKLHFNNELPTQIGLDWNQLMPDYPYLSLRDALLLGDTFKIHGVRFSHNLHTPEAWCNVSLPGDGDEDVQDMPNLPPAALVYGEHRYCFYCGQRSHAALNCPSRFIDEHARDVWNDVAALDLNGMKSGVAEIQRRLESNPESLPDLLKGDNLANIMARAIFSVNGHAQQRSIPIFWRLRGKTYPKSLDELTPEDDSPVWALLRGYHERDLSVVDKELQNMAVRYPRDYRILSLHGFVSMERGDFARAEEYWRKAHLLSHPGLMQAYHLFLVARLAEYQGKYADAILKYNDVQEAAPGWREIEYRKMVCYVKSGFTERAIPMIGSLITAEPKLFNWLLLDPELERGYTAILRTLGAYWADASVQVQQERMLLQQLSKDLHNWFTADSDFLVDITQRVNRLQELSDVQNFVPYQMVIQGRQRLERDFQVKIMNEIRSYKSVFSQYLARLAHIRDEAAWFPFPKLLVEFNRNYNASAANLTWVTHNNMHIAEVFKKAQELIKQEQDRIDLMEKRLRLLRIVRDGTLFSLIVIKKFLWMELAGLALILLLFPLTIYYGDKFGLSWISGVFSEQQWTIQKGAIIIVSILSLTIASFWTVLRFESIREKLFSKAKKKAEAKSAERLKQMEERQLAIKRRKQLARRQASIKGPDDGGT